MKTIDFNCDLGEGFGNEGAIMPFISSCNIACGGHAGDRQSMKNTLILAKEHGVKAGAHPSYPDRENFGRKIIPIPNAALRQSLVRQIKTLKRIAAGLQIPLQHIKFHGALYHQAAHDPETAGLVVDMIKNYFLPYLLYVPYPSLVAKLAAEAGLKTKYEVFADRNYNTDFQLLNRNHPNSLILNQEAVLEHVERIVKDKQIKTISGELLSVKVDTLCLHGDHPLSILLAPAIHEKLKQGGYLTL